MSTAARLRARWPLLMGIALIACFCAAFVARSAPLDDPFGFSHDGLIASKFGAAGAEWQLTRHAYADHPPLIYAATAASQGVVDHVASASSFPRRTEFAGRLVPAVATVVAI